MSIYLILSCLFYNNRIFLYLTFYENISYDICYVFIYILIRIDYDVVELYIKEYILFKIKSRSTLCLFVRFDESHVLRTGLQGGYPPCKWGPQGLHPLGYGYKLICKSSLHNLG